MNWVEWLGYFAAALVVLSFVVGSKVRMIRFINMLGAIAFLIYGFLLDVNLPIIIPNAFITCIQFYYLFIKKEAKEQSGKS
jgi:hypothetical protein